MNDLRERRKKSGMSQFRLAVESGVSRMRLSLAETDQVTLTGEEESSVRRVLNDYIARKAEEIVLLAQESRAVAP